MSIIVVGDVHWGIRGGDDSFLRFQKGWFDEILFKYMEENGIKHLILTGDVFDTRSHMKLNVMHEMIHWFVPRIKELGIHLYSFVGNHDIYYRDNNIINSQTLLKELLGESMTLAVDDVVDIEIDNHKVALCPWINKQNQEKILKQLDKSNSDVLLGHFELTGFPMYKGILNSHGMDPDLLSKFKRVISGHYHTVSEHKNIIYVGTPYHLTWSDFPDGTNRGFWILDDGDFQMIENPEWATMFSFIEYDPDHDYKQSDFDAYEGNISKVFISEVKDERHKKKFNEFLSKAKFLDYKVIDQTTVKVEKVEVSQSIIESKDMIKVMNDYIDKQESIIADKGNVKNLAKEIYLKALNV